jgi:hypothetical protein
MYARSSAGRPRLCPSPDSRMPVGGEFPIVLLFATMQSEAFCTEIAGNLRSDAKSSYDGPDQDSERSKNPADAAGAGPLLRGIRSVLSV